MGPKRERERERERDGMGRERVRKGREAYLSLDESGEEGGSGSRPQGVGPVHQPSQLLQAVPGSGKGDAHLVLIVRVHGVHAVLTVTEAHVGPALGKSSARKVSANHALEPVVPEPAERGPRVGEREGGEVRKTERERGGEGMGRRGGEVAGRTSRCSWWPS